MFRKDSQPPQDGLSERDKAMMPVEMSTPNRAGLAKRKEHILEMGDITPDDRRILETPIFETGDMVQVKRSDGSIDSGWEVTVPLNEHGKVGVMKKLGKLEAKKGVKEVELAKLNPGTEAGQTPDVEAAGRFEVGKEVTVERSSGGKDKGWRIIHIGDGQAVVHKLISGRDATKTVKIDDLRKWNPEA